MLTGWTQFSKKLRSANINIHRVLGKIYVFSVLLSGSAGLYLSFYATGGLVASFGFGAMAVFWLSTTVMAFLTIKKGQVDTHRNWMIRSCFVLGCGNLEALVTRFASRSWYGAYIGLPIGFLAKLGA